jgi:hypothetical protein
MGPNGKLYLSLIDDVFHRKNPRTTHSSTSSPCAAAAASPS